MAGHHRKVVSRYLCNSSIQVIGEGLNEYLKDDSLSVMDDDALLKMCPDSPA